MLPLLINLLLINTNKLTFHPFHLLKISLLETLACSYLNGLTSSAVPYMFSWSPFPSFQGLPSHPSCTGSLNVPLHWFTSLFWWITSFNSLWEVKFLRSCLSEKSLLLPLYLAKSGWQ